MVNFDIDLRILRAVNNAASTDEARYYLKGIHVEPLNDCVQLVSTDGHILLAARAEINCKVAPSFIIPSELVKRLKIKVTKPQIGTISLAGDNVTIEFEGVSHTSKLIDGCFPDWRRVFPRNVNDEIGHYDVGLFAQLVNAAKALGQSSECITIGQCGKSPALVNIVVYSDKAVQLTGIITPSRQPDAIETAPGWCVNFPSEYAERQANLVEIRDYLESLNYVIVSMGTDSVTYVPKDSNVVPHTAKIASYRFSPSTGKVQQKSVPPVL